MDVHKTLTFILTTDGHLQICLVGEPPPCSPRHSRKLKKMFVALTTSNEPQKTKMATIQQRQEEDNPHFCGLPAFSNSSFITSTVWVLYIWSALGTECNRLCLPFICLSKGKTFCQQRTILCQTHRHQDLCRNSQGFNPNVLSFP